MKLLLVIMTILSTIMTVKAAEIDCEKSVRSIPDSFQGTPTKNIRFESNSYIHVYVAPKGQGNRLITLAHKVNLAASPDFQIPKNFPLTFLGKRVKEDGTKNYPSSNYEVQMTIKLGEIGSLANVVFRSIDVDAGKDLSIREALGVLKGIGIKTSLRCRP